MSDVETNTGDVPSVDYSGDRVVAWEGGAPVRAEDTENRDKSTVETAGSDLLGAPAVTGDAGPVVVAGDTSEVPSNASEVVAWIRDGEEQSEQEATRRAGLAWSVEAERDGGVRSTVEAEVDKWLEAGNEPTTGS